MTDKDSILVVDDAPMVREVLSGILSAEGYQVWSAESGELALASVAEKPPELILMDIRMPGMDGFEVLRQLKARQDCRDIPVILISGEADTQERVESLKLGAVDFITKPFHREELLARVRMHLKLRQLLARLQAEIDERKHVEEALALDKDRLETLLKLSELKAGSEKEVTDFALEEAVRLTHSKGGYLHFFNQDEQTIQLYSWSKDVLKICTAAKDEHYPLDKAGVWTDSVRLKKTVIHNDYQNLAGKMGYPEGHFHLVRHLGAPIFDHDRIVGVMGVGNKEAPYNDLDALQVSLFMNSMWQILKQKRTEDEREKLIIELREALANVRQLSGMLPICASCKQIRDDKGYWKTVETYITEHSGAVFTSGICPKCEIKMYEELEKMKNEDGR